MFPPNIGPYAGTPVNLESCWRCANRVEQNDELGLCEPCIEALQDPDRIAPAPTNAVYLQVERERAEALEREMRESG